MPFASFHVVYVEIPTSFVAFLFEPFGKNFATFRRIPQHG
jgi:hypothetical protein